MHHILKIKTNLATVSYEHKFMIKQNVKHNTSRFIMYFKYDILCCQVRNQSCHKYISGCNCAFALWGLKLLDIHR